MSEAIFGFVGVVIGAILGIVTTYMQNKNNIDMFILQKRIETYLPIIEKYLKSTRDISINSTKDIIDEFQLLTPELLLYGSDKVKNQTEKVKNNLLENRFYLAEKKSLSKDKIMNELIDFVELVELMREELKMK
ncbi:hypothetical protein NE479_01750 [Phascolarctobacterium faecium]|uniref:hypothetical protein n=1 Tax=Phascolarctobacterium faecium TaxID=33025 RepID=UPI0021097D3E|nr:hypothetical protein [Phascolarctobacterium faecium]MCQ4906290.1 hypothetical protein [Phascolarctobacterium faecium]